MPQKGLGGTAYIKVDGRQYQLRGNLTVSIDAFEREGVAGMDGTHGYLERPRVQQISCDLTDSDGLSLADLRAIKDATVTAELNNGKTALLSNAWTSSAHEVNASDAQVSVVFQGLNGRWL